MKLKFKYLNSAYANIWLIHGFTESSECFEQAFHEGIAKTCNIFVPDLPGFGVSELFVPFDLDKVVEDLFNLIISQSSSQKIYLLGHSIGGSIAVMVAKKLIILKRDITLINVDGLLLPEIKGTSGLSFVHNYNEPEAFKHFLLEYWSVRVKDDEYLKRYVDNIKSMSPDVLHAWALAIIQFLDKDKILLSQKGLAPYTIYIYGDKSINSRNNEAAKKLGLKTNIIDFCGHWPMLEQKKTFWELVDLIVR